MLLSFFGSVIRRMGGEERIRAGSEYYYRGITRTAHYTCFKTGYSIYMLKCFFMNYLFPLVYCLVFLPNNPYTNPNQFVCLPYKIFKIFKMCLCPKTNVWFYKILSVDRSLRKNDCKYPYSIYIFSLSHGFLACLSISHHF